MFQNYINDNAYEAAFHDDLWRAMQTAADDKGLKNQNGKNLDVKAILDTWILQMGMFLWQHYSYLTRVIQL